MDLSDDSKSISFLTVTQGTEALETRRKKNNTREKEKKKEKKTPNGRFYIEMFTLYQTHAFLSTSPHRVRVLRIFQPPKFRKISAFRWQALTISKRGEKLSNNL